MSEENPDMEKTWKNNLCMKSLKCPIWWSHPSTFNLAKHQTFNHPNLAKMVVQVEVPETIGSFISPNKNSSWNHPCPTSKLGLPAMPRSELRSGDRDLKKRTAATQKIPDNWNSFWGGNDLYLHETKTQRDSNFEMKLYKMCSQLLLGPHGVLHCFISCVLLWLVYQHVWRNYLSDAQKPWVFRFRGCLVGLLTQKMHGTSSQKFGMEFDS